MPVEQTTNTQNTIKSKIINHIRAGYQGLYLVSPEEQRLEAELHQIT
jgi:hypothetical protein